MKRFMLLAILCVAGSLLSSAASAQTRRPLAPPPARARLIGPSSHTRLQVKRSGGEQTVWSAVADITTPHAVTFHWASQQPGATKAYYQVFDVNPTWDMSVEMMAKAISRAALGPLPAADTFVPFDIDFAAFAPAQAPVPDKVYYVRVITTDAQGRLVGAPSVPVRVIYTSPNAPVKIDE